MWPPLFFPHPGRPVICSTPAVPEPSTALLLSLVRFKTDRIALCQIQHPDRRVPIEESLGELSRLDEEGKVLSIGVSNFNEIQLSEALGACRSLSIPIPLNSTTA